jgi:hypothetical protein
MLAALGAGSLLVLPRVASAGEVSSVKGTVKIDGRVADANTPVFSGDTVETGPASQVIFKLNEDAFLLRANSTLKLEKKTQFDPLISGLRLLTGALAVVFGKGPKKIYAQTLTAGIRGTGIYLESGPDFSYFCTCYGASELLTRGGDLANEEREQITSSRHVSRYVYRLPQNGGTRIVSAATINHTDQEMAMLESLVGRSCPLMEGT